MNTQNDYPAGLPLGLAMLAPDLDEQGKPGDWITFDGFPPKQLGKAEAENLNVKFWCSGGPNFRVYRKPNPNSPPKLPGQLSREEYQRMVDADRRKKLAKYGTHAQAKAIADHYVSHLQTAIDLRRLIQHRESLVITHPGAAAIKHADEAIEHMAKTIRLNHQAAFGIPLDWEEVSR